MAKAVISSVLESLLGKYVDGLSGDSLQVGLWSGELTLHNLTLKPHALAELQLPIKVVKGSIKRIHVVVPWNQLGSASVQIAIEGVYALVVPNTTLPSAEEVRQAKRGQLERQELLRQHDRLAAVNNAEGEDESTFLSRLMTRIVDNLQIALRDIHFRYEDNVSNPETPFACGLMIRSFTFHTTDAEGNDVFVDRTAKKERFLHKAVTLAWFGLYWDRLPVGHSTVLIQHHAKIEKAMGDMVHGMCKMQGSDKVLTRGADGLRLWIVRPCNLSARFTKNETTDFSRAAKYTVRTDLNDIVCALSREQYEDMLFVHHAFAGRQAIEAHFMSARCRPFHRATDRPREWWDYTTRLVLAKIVKRNQGKEQHKLKAVRARFSGIKTSRAECVKYVDAYRKQLRKGSALDPETNEAKTLNRFEMIYPTDVTMALRNAAEDAEEKARAEKAAHSASQADAGSSWYNYFFGGPSTSTASSLDASATALGGVLSEEGRANLQKAYDETVQREQTHEVPETCNLLSVTINLRRGQMALYQSRNPEPFFLGSLEAYLAVDVRPTNDWELRCRVQHVEILNGLADNTRFHAFCSLGNKKKASMSHIAPCASFDLGYTTQRQAAPNADGEPAEVTAMKVRLTMEPVRFMIDPSFIMLLHRFFVNMLPASQLDKVWDFATSSVSDWIFSDEDEEDLYQQTVGRRAQTTFDVVVDVNAPVVVIAETVSEESSPTVVVDFGRFQFKNEDASTLGMKSTERLYWSTEMTSVNVLLGRLDALTNDTVPESSVGFSRVIDEFSIRFDLDSSVSSYISRGRDSTATTALAPNLCARAVLPQINMRASESQIIALAQIHSSLQAQFVNVVDEDVLPDVAEETVSFEQEDYPFRPTQVQIAKPSFKDKYAVQVAIQIEQVTLQFLDNVDKEAFRFRLAGMAFDLDVYSSRTRAQARLHSLILEDCLYDERSKFFYLLSTDRQTGGNDELIVVDVTVFATNPEAADHNSNREADIVANIKCSVLHVQWNPSSIALLYQILSAYANALQTHTIQDMQVPVATSSRLPNQPNDINTEGKPPLLLSATLVQLTFTFNKDQLDRQLVRLAIENAGFEYKVTSASDGHAYQHNVRGHLGDLMATDLSLKKHPIYDPFVGLYAKHRSSQPFLKFTYSWSDDPRQRSSLSLHFEPIRVVYYHQQLMELVDYLFEGILGAMVAETLATATRLLLAQEEASVVFEIHAKCPTLILPIRLDQPSHWRLTTDALSLEHFPSSTVRFIGNDEDILARERVVQHSDLGIASVETGESVTLRADCKRIRLENVNIFCASEDEIDQCFGILRNGVNFVVDVDDLVSTALSPIAAVRALPRFTVRVAMNDIAVELAQWEYVAAMALLQNNFGAEMLFTSATNPDEQDTAAQTSSRPTMMYSYSRTDIEAVTWRLTFDMNSIQCDLYENEKQTPFPVRADDLIDEVIASTKKTKKCGRHIATFTGTKLTVSIDQLCDRWPSISVHANEFSLLDRATNSLSQSSNSAHELHAFTPGAVVKCQNSFSAVYSWDGNSKKSTIDLDVSCVESVVVPEFILLLLEYFSPQEETRPSSQALTRRRSITTVLFNESDQSEESDVYEHIITLSGKTMTVAFPQDVFDADSEQVVMRADFKVCYTLNPDSRRQKSPQVSASDLDIKSSLVMDATGIEFFFRNARRQGCSALGSAKRSEVVQIVDPCNMRVEVSDLFPHAGQKQQIVALKVSPVEVFVSYEDTRVITDAVESSSSSISRYSERNHVRALSSSQLTEPSIGSIHSNPDTQVEVHRYFTSEIGEMSLTLINDCDGCDMGLLQLQTQRSNLFLNVTLSQSTSSSTASPTTSISGGGSISTLVSYYNPDTRDWHPMCSEWGLDVSVQGSIFDDRASSNIDGNTNELHIIITANHSLDLAVTHGLLEVFASAIGAWNRRSSLSDPKENDRGISPNSKQGRQVKAPCIIRNDTGLPLMYWVSSEVSDQDSGKHASVVASGNAADVHYMHTNGRGCGVARRYANRDREGGGGMRLHLHAADAPFQAVRNIEFEELGSRAFELLDVRTGKATRYALNVNSELVDGRIVLTVSSQVKVVSTLGTPIQLLVNDPTWASPVEIGVLYPHRESAVPIMASLGTELRVRPLADAMYGWSAPIPIQTRSGFDLQVESTSAEATKNAVYCVSMTLSQSLRVVTFAEPIVLINKLPVDLSFRVKTPLSGNNASGSSASNRERISVGSKTGVWWADRRQRPQFELTVNGCQTSRWIELTQAANSSKTSAAASDVISIMLLRQDGRPFKLLIQVVEQPTKSLHISFYAEVWFVNRTGLDLVFGNESEQESYFPPPSARTLVGNAQIVAYSSSNESPSSGSPTVRLTMPSCGWSSRFNADPRRLSWQDECLTLKADARRGGNDGAGNMLYEFGISADYATRHFGSITTLISVIPRYLVMNQSSYTVLLLEDSGRNNADSLYSNTGEAHHILAKGDVYALYWVTGTRSRLRTSVLDETAEFGWSETVSYDHAKLRTVDIPCIRGSANRVKLQVSVKQGSISQATIVVVISDTPDEDVEVAGKSSGEAGGRWDVLTVHTQLAGLIVTLADKQTEESQDSSSTLFGSTIPSIENVARLTITRVTAELSSSRQATLAKLNVMGVKVEDLLQKSNNPVVLRPVARGDSFSNAKGGNAGEKSFLEISYVEKPHTKYRWVDQLKIDLQDVRIATSMRFVDRLNKVTKETLAHFDSHAYSTTLTVFDEMDGSTDPTEENILEYFVTTDDDAAMTSITGQKVYIESCEIAPVRVVVSFTREKGDVRNDPNAGFWLSNLKFKIDNACLTLDAFKLSHAMATQEAIFDSLSTFYVKSVKSQALGLIESVQVTTLVTSAVTSGVSSLVSTIMGKTDPSLANASQTFRYQFLTNNQIMTKHSKLLAECQSTAQFLQQVKHLVYDWDSNHTGLEARGCVALGILNNSRHSLVVNVQLNDGAEIRVLPAGRKHLASVINNGSSDGSWRSDRSMVIFAWGYTPTLLTSGDVYFTVQSNACNVFVTRKTARLKANIGYTATFTHQETQQWWSSNVVIVGDDLHGHVSSATGLFGDLPTPSSASTPSAASLPPMPLQPSESDGMLGDEYEVVFTTASLGLIAKQSGPRNVIVRECLTLPSGAPSPALACGKISHGDTILTVNGVSVTNTSQFRDLVSGAPRPVVLRFRRTGERFNANEAFDLFGERHPAPSQTSSALPPQGTKDDDAFDLFGVGR